MLEFEVIHDGKNRSEWIDLRRLGIGSSDAPAILGVSPFASALSVYTDKIGLSEDAEDSEPMKWGRILEPHILEQFSAETNRSVRGDGKLIRSVLRPFMQATLDGRQESDDRGDCWGLVECKATGWRVGDWSEGIPLHVWVQMQHQFSVTGWTWGSVVVLQHGCRLLWADVERDDAFIEGTLIPAEAEFWSRVQAGEPVDPDGSESARKALQALYPSEAPGVIVHLDPEMIELDQELAELKESSRDLEHKIRERQQRIQAAIGTAEEGQLPNGVAYTYRTQSRAEHVVRASTFRVLRRRAAKEI